MFSRPFGSRYVKQAELVWATADSNHIAATCPVFRKGVRSGRGPASPRAI